MQLWDRGDLRSDNVGRFLENHYYYNNDGIKDEIVNSLGDCLVQCAYLILKNRDDFKSDYYTAF